MKNRTPTQCGSVFFLLFSSLVMVGLIGAACLHLLKGPVKTMAQVTKRTIAENNMMASGRLALIMSVHAPGDCDNDGLIEPVAWSPSGSVPAPVNGGLLPPTIGASLLDPWGNAYGYCAWDHGGLRNAPGCGASSQRLAGDISYGYPVIAIVSSGPDKIFQTGCLPHGQANYILKTPGSDDLVLSYTYAEAITLSAGLWNLKADDASTATISKNLSVTDNSGSEQFTFDAQQKELTIGAGGTGALPNIRTDYIQNLTENAPVEFLTDIKTTDVEASGSVLAAKASIATEEENAVAAIVTSSGDDGIALKVSGTSKAIEAEGILDMTGHKIINLLPPAADNDAATKKYVDDRLSVSGQTIQCESFVFTSCTGSAPQNLTKTNLGTCKKACEEAGVQCCEAEFASLPGNPNAALSNCKGYNAPSQTSGGLRNILTILLGGGKFVAALCYLE